MKISEVTAGRSKEFDKQDMGQMKAEEVADFIKRHCKPWLSQTDNGDFLVYRGFKRIKDDGDDYTIAFRKKVRKDRQPHSSTPFEHELFGYLIDAGKKVANRTNAVFATSNWGDAKIYGKAFVILPIGKFNYTWHENYRDWWTDLELDKDNLIIKNEEDFDSPVAERHRFHNQTVYLNMVEVEDWLEGLHGDDGTLKKAIDESCELMIACDEILAVDAEMYETYVRGLLRR